MIDVSEVITDPDFAQTYTIYRQTGGQWVNGRWVDGEVAFSVTGVVTPPNAKELEQVPEGDRVTGLMCFYATVPLYITRVDETDTGTSDQIEWRGDRYRLIQIFNYGDYGYYKALGQYMTSE